MAEGKFNSHLIYDSGASTPINDGNVNQSNVASAPGALYIDNGAGAAITAGTTITVQARLADTDSWVAVGSGYTNANTPALVGFNPRYNFVRVLRSGGSANARVRAQS